MTIRSNLLPPVSSGHLSNGGGIIMDVQVRPHTCLRCGQAFMAPTWYKYCLPCQPLAKKERNKRAMDRRRKREGRGKGQQA